MTGDTRAWWLVPLRVRGAERLEVWFEDQASRGWVAEHLGFLSAVRLVLHHRVDPPRYRYVIDPRRFPDVVEDDLLRAAGWEEVGTLGGKDVWRAPYEGARPDLLGH
ncbi:DUF2812 domain-containing protein [Mumia sp. zg.B53]|uniref:DUF2812 domain-containing protein n=1 Tax=Mumia sp. zg.B53 TaxID=2855449 RepID=UPI001C6E0178|nr:DUF2812 domain-containing protein [Mumia sp. zg.B53]MBW9215010.1 DUF2812 domain-containing protein [Mumia sp. zg.B53]